MRTDEQLLTFEEVRQRLTVSESTLFRLMKDGALTPVRVSKRRITFRPADVERYLAERAQRTTGAETT